MALERPTVGWSRYPIIVVVVSLCAGLLAAFAPARAAIAASVLSLGPQALQSLVTEQLFDRGGRWYLIDDGACYTYLKSPHVRLASDRLILKADLTSKLGQRFGNSCAGADLASNVTLSGKLRGTEHELILDDIRIDRVEDEAVRNALNLALQVAPESIPRQAHLDVLEILRKQVSAPGSAAMHVDQIHILNIQTRTDALVIQFDLNLSAR